MKHPLPQLSALLFALTIGAPSHAAALQDSHAISPMQLEQIKAGLSRNDVEQLLGAPKYTPHWGNGSYSMSYELIETDGHSQHIYVDVDERSQKVVGYSLGNE